MALGQSLSLETVHQSSLISAPVKPLSIDILNEC